MASLNKVLIMGNLTRDPELRYTPKGTAVADLSIAINRLWRNDAGEKQEETTFVDVTLWGKTAELAQKYLVKGRGIYVEGRLQLESWDDKETGKKRSKLKIIGENMQFLPGGGDRATAPASPAPAAAQPRLASQSAPADQDEDDIPF